MRTVPQSHPQNNKYLLIYGNNYKLTNISTYVDNITHSYVETLAKISP
jgi:hypothetical protein